MFLDAGSTETFWTLLHDAAHWEFELFLMLIFDIILGGLCWPFVKKHWKHHIDRDQREGIDKRIIKQQFTQSVLSSYGIHEEDVISFTVTNDSLTVVLRPKYGLNCNQLP